MVNDDKSEKHLIFETWKKGGYVWGLRGEKEIGRKSDWSQSQWTNYTEFIKGCRIQILLCTTERN